MGSGCLTIQNKASECGNYISSNCVKYQGEPVPALGICTGDTITEIESVIISYIQKFLIGEGITLPQVTLDNCPYLLALFTGKDKTLTNLFQLLIDSQCSLKAIIDQIQTQLQPSNFVFDLKCLDPITDPNIPKIVQGTINTLCALKLQVDTLIAGQGNTTIIDARVNVALDSLITSDGNVGYTKTVDPNGLPHYHFTSLMPIHGAVMYVGPLSNFDGNGVGFAGTQYANWRLLNGQGGTIDMRGFIPVGQVQGVQGGTLDPIVDPVLNANASMNYNFGDKGGSASVIITKTNLPNIILSGTINTLTVSFNTYKKYTRFQTSNSQMWAYGPDTTGGDPAAVTITANSVSGGTVNVPLGGSGAGLENRMPYKAINWIVKFQ